MIRSTKVLTFVLLAVVQTLEVSHAEGLTYGIAGKSASDRNFVDTWQGCNQAAQRWGDRCVFIGSEGPAQPRQQASAIISALAEQKFDALAVSVVHSKLIAGILERKKIPVITFDSPFSPPHSSAALGYVGMDNVAFGRDLAKAVLQLRVAPATICIMSSVHDPNMMLRTWGVRQGLSGDLNRPPGQPLTGEGGWTESPRCPWDSGDDVSRALMQVEATLRSVQPDVLISLGHWMILDPQRYRQTIAPFFENIEKYDPVIVAAVGEGLPAYDELVEDRLLHGYVYVDFRQIGEKAAELMRQAVNGEDIPPVTVVPHKLKLAE
ncbi:substrate-binding domain-containing protein [Allohahella sp. A8]|uniref:substrate-binding domain-containing protein n=1 Tax=Allohahella sp. A8 TaxID=3141461 RepID=UPI003A7F81AF